MKPEPIFRRAGASVATNVMLDQEETSEVESDGLLGQSRAPLHKGFENRSVICFIIAISVSLNFCLVAFGFIYWVSNKQSNQRSYENGFESDLGSIKMEIELSQYRFSGGVEVNEKGDFFVDTSSSQQYVGNPTPEIDVAWARLLTGINIDLEDSEAGNIDGRTFQWPGSGLYFTGLDVFHSLHCLNRIRQAFYPDYYDVFSDPESPSRDDHIGHCINHLRQAIQCHADLTPMEWTQVGNKVILKTDTPHTCRNFEKIQDWARNRRTHFDEKDVIRNGSLFFVD